MRICSRQRGFTLLEAAVVVAVLVVLASLLVLKTERTLDDAKVIGTRASLQAVAEAFTGSAVGPGYIADMKHFPAPDFEYADIRISKLLDEPPNSLGPSAPNPLLFNPLTRRGWRGPYVKRAELIRVYDPEQQRSNLQGTFPLGATIRFKGDQTFSARGFFSHPYGFPGESAVGDTWGNPVVLQIPLPSEISNSTPEKQWKYARLVSAGPNGFLETPMDRLAGRLVAGTARGDDLVLFLNRADLYDEIDQP